MSTKDKKADQAASTETKAAKPAKPASDKQNGVTRPAKGTKTGRVWDLADELSKKHKTPARRKDVLDAALAEGIPTSTGATQYGKWRKYHGLGRETPAAEPKAEAKAEAKAE